MDTQIVVYLFNRILFTNKKERTTEISTTRMNPMTMLNQRSQTQKNTLCVVLFKWSSRNSKTKLWWERNRNSGCLGDRVRTHQKGIWAHFLGWWKCLVYWWGGFRSYGTFFKTHWTVNLKCVDLHLQTISQKQKIAYLVEPLQSGFC